MSVFNFDAGDLKNSIKRAYLSKMEESLKYLNKTLKFDGHSKTITDLENIDLNNANWMETKSYFWLSIECEDMNFFIRRYNTHFTIFCTKSDDMFNDTAIFTFSTNTSKLSDDAFDTYYDKPCLDLNKSFKDIINEFSTNNTVNDYAIKVEDHIKVSEIYTINGIESFDKFIFCCEEISTISKDMFATHETYQKVIESAHRVGEKFNKKYTIKDVYTKLEDNYYHNIGFNLIDGNGNERFHDVYSLTEWYFEETFKES